MPWLVLPFGLILLTIAVSAAPVVAQRYGRSIRAGAVLFSRIEGGGGAGGGRGDVLVVVAAARRSGVATIHHAAGPGVMVVGRPGLAVRRAVALAIAVVRVAAAAVVGVPIGPVDPGRLVVGGVDVDVLHERHDRHVDVTVVDGGRLQLRQQRLGGGDQRRHLAVVGHRAGVVEHQRDAKPGIAPLHLGVRRRPAWSRSPSGS